MSSFIAGIVGGLIGLILGTAQETIRGAITSMFRRGDQRAQQGPEMRSVVMEVEPFWKGSWYEYNDLSVAVLTANLTLANHSKQLVKNVRVTMHRRPHGIDTAKMVLALPAGEIASVSISRELGLVEDAPFEEEQGNWLDFYWFEAEFEDTRGASWRLYYNPRDEKQTVERQTS